MKLSLWGVVFLSLCLPHNALGQAKDKTQIRWPLAGHPVEVHQILTLDKLARFHKEFKKLKLILMEPGVRINKSIPPSNGIWFKARVFNIEGETENFPPRSIIEFEAARFR